MGRYFSCSATCARSSRFSLLLFYFMLTRPHSLRSESFDYRVTELYQRRAKEMEAGLYVEVSGAGELKAQPVLDAQPTEEETEHER